MKLETKHQIEANIFKRKKIIKTPTEKNERKQKLYANIFKNLDKINKFLKKEHM